MKILCLGNTQINFLYYLFKSIKDLGFKYNFSVLEPHDNSGSEKYVDKELYDCIRIKRIGVYYRLLALFKSFSISKYYGIIIYIVFVERKFSKLLHFLWKWNREFAFTIKNNYFSDYSILHFNYMQYSYLRCLFFLPKEAKAVCSFWGSDLLRTSDTFNHYVVMAALERADIITVQSSEMREIVLSKFGRPLKNKIVIIKFSLDRRVFDEISFMDKSKQLLFQQKNKIPHDKTKIVIGHNSSRYNNHVDILDSLDLSIFKNDVHFLFPYAYGLADEDKEKYKKEIEASLNRQHYKYTFLEEYFDYENLALLRLSSDLMIHLPESDALSGTVTELMYAGNLLVTWKWLPYRPFEEAGLYFKSIDSYDQLTDLIRKIVHNIDLEKEKCKSNKTGIELNFFPKVTGRQWAELYSRLLH